MRRFITYFFGACLISLAGCGGGGSSDSGSNGSDTPPTQTVSKGTLSITIKGLPENTDSNVSITGPDGYNNTITSSETLTDLAVGSYTVTANDVTADALNFDVLPTTYTVTVTKNTTTNLQLVYQTPVISTGVVSNFGSIYVNGTRYETNTTEFKDEDGDPTTEEDFEVGMLVTVVGRTDADGENAQAEEVYFELKAKGPIEAIS